ncbi:AP-3 complex subunit beta-2-like [Gigantopelta aegis]|uniref:AP-3 complex subunit beta-2-like n=1 Tax=Gigantopelta aegis TaxID=1735272 RepID=UPI001B887865|nr:AP-3 complex subunit beta-2-like [Gigantopelta aegis]
MSLSGNGLQLSSSYANDKPPSSTGSGDAELANDPASSGFFTTDFKRHEDLKTMLDSNKDNLKLEAMKRIVGMVAKGKDASDLFPAVVKNVVSKNLEIKKLVYVYLTRYAEEQQDLALLSISTFQRALKDPNQLIRASALRVLSSVRVTVIAPIMMLAIKEAVMDMSPYVRKTAAHGIPKLYSLDPETKDQLMEVIERLLTDKTTLVAGSAIQAFEEVCPERIDLIHKNYRKLVNLLVDVEEWGQVVIINMLTRYCRTQFVNPNLEEEAEEADRPFYDDSEKSSEEEDDEKASSKLKKKVYIMDSDHRLLLRQAKPLLNSRNAAVVMAVAQLYYHCAPKAEVGVVSKSLIRLLRNHKEIQYVVLSNIATMTIRRKGMFEPHLKSFYVRSSDALHIKLLKLEILTNLATETNISTVLRELQTYVLSPDKEFAAATIQAIGRCASNISEITDACLNGLVHLMSNRDESVVAESVVVIKKLLQMRPRSRVKRKKDPTEHRAIITHMAKMVEQITVPMARASILWLIGEYSERVPKIAPDVLRKMAKTFITEEDIVKLQVLNLSAKLCITNPKQTKLLCQYVLNLAKYDQNYDIRDRSRFLRQLVLPGEKGCVLAKYAKKIFLATKPAPVLESRFNDIDQYQLGTLSHLINARAHGYQELPEWPEVAPDTTVRNVSEPVTASVDEVRQRAGAGKKKTADLKSFYSEDESSEEDESESEDEESSGEVDSSDEEEESDEGSEASGKVLKSDATMTRSMNLTLTMTTMKRVRRRVTAAWKRCMLLKRRRNLLRFVNIVGMFIAVVQDIKESKTSKEPKEKKARDEANLLLDLDDLGLSSSTSVPVTPGNMLTPTAFTSSKSDTAISQAVASGNLAVQPVNVKTKTYELLSRMKGNGLNVCYKFTRTISIFSPKMVSIELSFTNLGETNLQAIGIGDKKLQPGMEIQDFPEIATLAVGASTSVLMGINYNDTTQPATFELTTKEQKFNVSITAPVGELLQPHTMSEMEFTSQQGKLSGMNENVSKVNISESNQPMNDLCRCVHTVANVLQIPSSDDAVLRFAAKTVAMSALVLITVMKNDDSAKMTVNCEKMVIATMLLKDIKAALEK